MSESSYIKSILHYFTKMDIDNLRLHLKDEYNYEDTTKEIFLNEIEKIFDAHKNLGDTELLIYKGACAGKRCENCGKKGFRFVGNNSKNYMDLLFEIEDDDIKDIYDCSYFKPDVEIDGIGKKAFIYFNEDDRISFKRTPDYWFKVYSASAAYNEIITRPPRQINFEELSYWVDKHSVTDELIGSYDIFKPEMKWGDFSKLYADLKEIRTYITNYLDYIIEAASEIGLIKTEQQLIDWLLKNETLFEVAPFEFKFRTERDNDCCILKYRKPILLKDDSFSQSYNFLSFYDKNYHEMLSKYNTYTQEEEREVYNNKDLQKDGIDATSLRFHLEKRKAMEEIGIEIPFYINNNSCPF
jgi:hypothetical protein